MIYATVLLFAFMFFYFLGVLVADLIKEMREILEEGKDNE